MSEIPLDVLETAQAISKAIPVIYERDEHILGTRDIIIAALMSERERHQPAHDVVADIVELGRLPSGRARSKWLTIPAAIFHRATVIQQEN